MGALSEDFKIRIGMHTGTLEVKFLPKGWKETIVNGEPFYMNETGQPWTSADGTKVPHGKGTRTRPNNDCDNAFGYTRNDTIGKACENEQKAAEGHTVMTSDGKCKPAETNTPAKTPAENKKTPTKLLFKHIETYLNQQKYKIEAMKKEQTPLVLDRGVIMFIKKQAWPSNHRVYTGTCSALRTALTACGGYDVKETSKYLIFSIPNPLRAYNFAFTALHIIKTAKLTPAISLNFGGTTKKIRFMYPLMASIGIDGRLDYYGKVINMSDRINACAGKKQPIMMGEHFVDVLIELLWVLPPGWKSKVDPPKSGKTVYWKTSGPRKKTSGPRKNKQWERPPMDNVTVYKDFRDNWWEKLHEDTRAVQYNNAKGAQETLSRKSKMIMVCASRFMNQEDANSDPKDHPEMKHLIQQPEIRDEYYPTRRCQDEVNTYLGKWHALCKSKAAPVCPWQKKPE